MLLDPRECDVLQDSIGQSERAKRIHRRHPRVGIDGDGLIQWLRSLSGNEARIVSEHTPRRVSVCLNCTLGGVTLVPTMRTPFDVLAEGLLSEESRGDWI